MDHPRPCDTEGEEPPYKRQKMLSEGEEDEEVEFNWDDDELEGWQCPSFFKDSLLLACKGGDEEEVLQVLKDNRIDIKFTNAIGESAIDIACEMKNKKIVRHLFKHPNCLLKPLHLKEAIKLGDEESLQILLNRLPLLKDGSNTPTNYWDEFCEEILFTAIHRGNAHFLPILLSDERIKIMMLKISFPDYEMEYQLGAELHYACLTDAYHTVRKLLEDDKVEVNALDHRMMAPIHYVACLGNVQIMKMLLADKRTSATLNMNPEATKQEGEEEEKGEEEEEEEEKDYETTPLLQATKNGHEEVVNLLIPHLTNMDIREALTRAYHEGHVSIAKLLQSHVLIESTDFEELGVVASERGHVDILKFLFSHKNTYDFLGGPSKLITNKRYNTFLAAAIQHSRPALVATLLEKNFSIKKDLIGQAFEIGNLDVIRLLVPFEDNLNIILHYMMNSYSKGYIHVVRSLLEREEIADAFHQRLNGLLLACATGNVTILREIISISNEEINTTDRNGVSPLHIASVLNDINMLKVLLEQPSINTRAVNNEGKTALQCAVESGKIHNVEILLSHFCYYSKEDLNHLIAEDVVTFACQTLRSLDMLKIIMACPKVDLSILKPKEESKLGTFITSGWMTVPFLKVFLQDNRLLDEGLGGALKASISISDFEITRFLLDGEWIDCSDAPLFFDCAKLLRALPTALATKFLVLLCSFTGQQSYALYPHQKAFPYFVEMAMEQMPRTRAKSARKCSA